MGDTGEITGAGQLWRIVNTQKAGNAFLHFLEDKAATLAPGAEVEVAVNRRAPCGH